MLDELKMSGRSMTACTPKKSRLKSKIGTVGKLHQLYLGSGDKTTCPDAGVFHSQILPVGQKEQLC